MRGKKYTPDIVNKILGNYVFLRNYESVAKIMMGYSEECVGITARTVQRICKRHGAKLAELANNKKAILEQQYESIIKKCAQIIENKALTSSTQQVGTVMGITSDKLALLRGEPTQISKDITPEQKEKVKNRLLEAMGVDN